MLPLSLTAALCLSVANADANADASAETSSEAMSSAATAQVGFTDLLDFIEQERTASEVATFVQTQAIDVAAMVWASPAEEWGPLGARSIGDVLERQPGALIYNRNGFKRMAVRGFPLELGAAEVLDGMPLNGYYNRITVGLAQGTALWNLKKIETIRGPNSTLYGSDAFFAVADYQSWDSNEDHYETEVAAGTALQHRVSGKVSQGLLGERLRVTLAGSFDGQIDEALKYQYTDNDTSQVVEGELRKLQRRGSGHLKVAYEDLVEVAAYANKNVSRGFQGSNRAGLFPGVQAGHDLDWYAIRVGGAFRPTETGELTVNLFGWWLSTSAATGTIQGSDQRAVVTFRDESRAGAQLRYTHQLDLGVVQGGVTGGYDFTTLNLTRVQASAETTSADQQRPKQRVHAGYAQATLAALDGHLRAVAGARFDYYDVTGGHFSPRLGLVGKLDHRNALKLLYGHAFRAPSARESLIEVDTIVAGQASAFQADDSLEPEVFNSLELVLMTGLGPVDGSVSVYYNELSNGIELRTGGGNSLSRYANTASSSGYGGELEVVSTVGDLRLTANLAYQRARRDAPDIEPYVAFPTWLGNLRADYFWTDMGLWVTLAGRMQAEQFSGEGRFQLPRALSPYVRVDASVRWQLNPMWAELPVETWLFVNALNLAATDNQSPSAVEIEFGEQREGFTLFGGIRTSL